jgi:hypothetical protein
MESANARGVVPPELSHAKVSHDFAHYRNSRARITLASASAEGRRMMEDSMFKAAKYGLAAALILSGTGLALAQGGAGGEPPRGSDANPPAAVKQQPGATQSAPAAGPNAPAASGAKQVQNPAAPAAQGAETGSARDSAGPGGNRNANESGNTKGPAGMTQRPSGMPTTPSNAGSETGTAPDPAGPGAERKKN